MRLAKSANVSSPWRSLAKRSVSRFTTSGMRFDGTAPIARPYEPPFSSHWPPSTTWKCGTRHPPTLRLTP